MPTSTWLVQAEPKEGDKQTLRGVFFFFLISPVSAVFPAEHPSQIRVPTLETLFGYIAHTLSSFDLHLSGIYATLLSGGPTHQAHKVRGLPTLLRYLRYLR